MLNPKTPTKHRIESIDIVRGAVMLIMAIDHVRDTLHKGHPTPTDLSVTTPILFFTRFITHFCAPTFVFLSGISARLAGMRRTPKEQSLFLIKRGVWLVIIECTVVSLGLTANPFYNLIILQVIWAIGGSMILLGLLIRFKATPMIIGIIGLIIFLGHNIFDIVNPGAMGKTTWWTLLLSSTGYDGVIPLNQTHFLNAPYALLPWTGVMFAGYAAGTVYSPSFDVQKRKKLLLNTGLGLLVLFFVFRAFNIYGDPAPWSVQRSKALTVISFFNTTKYPCSLLYLSMTLSITLIALSRLEGIKTRFTDVVKVYGNVPFFYYICHWYLIQTITILLFFIMGYNTSQIATPPNPIFFEPDGFGFNLAGVYLIWLGVLLIMYRPCKWYSNYKKTHHQWWLSYI